MDITTKLSPPALLSSSQQQPTTTTNITTAEIAQPAISNIQPTANTTTAERRFAIVKKKHELILISVSFH